MFHRQSRGIITHGKVLKITPSLGFIARKSEWLSFTNAAEKVLSQFGTKQPMHYREITDKALELGLISTSGQTPAATMYAQILMEIERRQKRGEKNRFEKHGKGLLSLVQLSDPDLAAQIEAHNDEIRRQLHTKLHKISPIAFEALVGQLLSALGFESVEVTHYSGDGGIDVRGVMVVGDVIRTRMAVQAKRWKNNVQAPTVQQVRGSLGAHEQGLIITISDFSPGARKEAERPDATPVALMNGIQLVNLLIEHNIGIQKANYDLLELQDDESFIPQ